MRSQASNRFLAISGQPARWPRPAAIAVELKLVFEGLLQADLRHSRTGF